MSRLSHAADAAIIVVAILAIVTLASTFFATGQDALGSFRGPWAPGLVIPSQFDVEKFNIDYDESVVLIINESCEYCTENLPFYRTLTEQNSFKVVIVALQEEPIDGYLQAARVFPDAVRYGRFEELRDVRGTPTLLVVDNKGTVLRGWLGYLDEMLQAEVLQVLG